MQNRQITPTRLEAQDLLATFDYASRPLPYHRFGGDRERHRTPPPTGHDFLVVSHRPDLAADFRPEALGTPQSWERNIPAR
ncbi:MAG: hypothetical protein ABIZ81_16275 [Opitutaceae bacterium]